MALARARFSPSTVISTLVPRATPRGATELSVGGVVRLPAPERTVAQSSRAALHPNVVDFKVAIEEPRCELVPAGRELQAERPVGEFGNHADLGEIGRAKELDIAVGRRGREQLPVR